MATIDEVLDRVSRLPGAVDVSQFDTELGAMQAMRDGALPSPQRYANVLLISLRVTGCPNGCARPYLAEIGLVGKAPNKYALYLGAKYNGTRLNRLVSSSITIDDAVTLLTPIIKRYAVERREGEGFGDFCDREIIPKDATFHSVGTSDNLLAVK